MKLLYVLIALTLTLTSCRSTKSNSTTTPAIMEAQQDTVKISNPELDYEITIIEPGFNSWLATTAKPEGFYSQSYLESKNNLYVNEYNSRVRQPLSYNPELYSMEIDYNYNVDYGYEVNYKLYNYFIYFQRHYNQQLSGVIPRN